jgi:hypothetical protein
MTTRTVQQVKSDIDQFNAEAKRLTAWSKQNQSPVDAGAQYMDSNSETFSALVEELFWAKWTPQFFASAKTTWMSCFSGNSANMVTIRAAEQKCGFLMSDIKKAKSHYEA